MMFTGLVEAMGEVVSAVPNDEGCTRLVVESRLGTWEHGESVAIDGACMSVAEPADGRFGVDVMPESLALTTLGGLGPGDRVNLERSLKVGDRLGGHFVSGHVDGVARVESIRRAGEDHRVRFVPDSCFLPYLPVKGSVTLAGVSLTISGADSTGFEVALIPLTLELTTLGALSEGSTVNLEVDVVARYLERLIRGIHEDR
jgi:riboflavin synthase